jgi:hypothetical protein
MDLACNLVRILDCDFIVELLADFKFRQDHCRIADFASNLGGLADFYTPIHPPPPNKVLNLLLVQTKWLGWKNNEVELLTTNKG